MRVLEYFSSDNRKHWLEQIGQSDWSAGQYLYRLLSQNELEQVVGKDPKVLLLAEGDSLVSFCTYTLFDDIRPTELMPWIGFVYTFPKYRGHRHAQKLFDAVENMAKAENADALYISTDHVGLYEKYGFEFYAMMTDIKGQPSRVYHKRLI